MTTKIQFERPHDAKSLIPHLQYAASLGLPMVKKDCHKGQRALICSTGPSIMDKKILKKIKKLAKNHVVFGLKETIPYLREHKINVKYTVSMDPGGGRQVARTPIDQDVIYCLASSCNPELYDHVLGGGCEIQVFHSACGESAPSYEPGILVQAHAHDPVHGLVKGVYELKTLEGGLDFCPLVPTIRSEIDLYGDLFNGQADVMCGGFTVTNRALALAKYMGFDRIVMAGTDFGWRDEGGSHYSGLVKVPANDESYMTDQGIVDGTPWFTKPDQLASAADVAKKIKANEVTVIGDSLAAALSKRSSEFLEDIVRLE